MGLMVLLVAVFQISVTAVAYKDITFFNAKALPNKAESIIICGYSAGSDRTTSFTYGRVIDTGTGAALPSGVTYANQGGNARKMTIQAGSDLPGVYYCDHSGFRLQTVLVASEAEIKPESQTKTVSWGDDVTLTMTTSKTGLKWKHNGSDMTIWDGQNSITITSAKPSDAGIYECYTTQQQRQDGLHGFMRLIVRRCPNGKYGNTCLLNCPTCYNGGICNSDTGECICPPGFTGDDCNTGCTRGYWGKSCGIKCSRSNTATACKGRMFCVSDPYGCSCLASHGGLDCRTEDCSSGTYGAGCTQTCHCTNGCNTKGECIISPGDCDAGWSGNKCKVPSSCPDGFYGELCNYNCHCKNKAACDKNTGVCQNGDCATGWINIDTVDSDCQQDGTPKIRRFLNHKVNPGEVYTTQFYCEVSGNPVSNSGDLKIWKSGTSDYLTLTNTGSSKYLVFVNSTSVNVDILDVYNCGYPSNGPKESINIQYYVLPTFRVNNGPSVNDFRSDQITVTWNEWTTDDIGDGPVEFYKVYYRMSDQNDWIPASTLISDTSQTNYKSNITGLQWSTEYEITVTVKRPGPLGEGSKDATITATTLCAIPQKPIIENVSSPELKQLEVHVQVPGVNDIKCKQDGVNGYVQYIELLYRKEGTQDEYEVQREDYKRSVTDTEVITITDDSLLPYTEYEVIALLSNADAKSSWSEAVTCRTSEDVPSKPRDVTLQPAVYTITVTWLEPDPPNGIITAYRITYWETDDDNTKKDISIENGDTNEYNVDNLQYRVHYSVQVSASTSVGEGECSDELNTMTTETIPRKPASIDVQSTTENSIRFTWTDPTIFSGYILQYRITYRSSESVYSTTVLESNDILIEGSIDTHTLEELPPGTQFEISVSARTSIGFGEPESIISGTKIGIDVSDILEESHKTTEPILLETKAIIGLRKPKLNTDIMTDTQLMSYIVVAEETRQKLKRDLEYNQYITASFPLNAIPDLLIVGDGMEYNDYINKPLTPGQQYVVYDGFTVNTTGEEVLMLHDRQLTSFTAGDNSNRFSEGENKIPMFIGGFAGGVVVTIVIGVLLLYLICRLKSRNKHKERIETHDIAHAGNESGEMRDYEDIHKKENNHYQDIRDVQENNYEQLKLNEYCNVAKSSMQT